MASQVVHHHSIPNRQSYGSQQLSVLDVVSRLAPRQWKELQNSRGRYSMACPLPNHDDRQHQDYSGSFSVDEAGQLWKCFGCGAGGNAVQLERILSGQTDADLNVQAPPRPQPRPPRKEKAEREQFQGVTIDQVAEAKGLDAEYLRNILGWQDTTWAGTPIVEIPYPDENSGDRQIRRRVGLDKGQRFLWKRGAKIRPYGLWGIPVLEAAGHIIFVEGETDFATLACHGYPVQGIPGASNWKSKWEEYYCNVPKQYIWKEPGPGGEAFVAKMAESYPDILVIKSPPGIKDPTELAVQIGAGFRGIFDQLLAEAKLIPAQNDGPSEPSAWADELSWDEIVAAVQTSPAEYRPTTPIPKKSLSVVNVGHLVKTKKPLYQNTDKTKEATFWDECVARFRPPTWVRPSMVSRALWSDKHNAGVIVDRYSNTWLNPANAAFKKATILFNMLPRLRGREVFRLRVPVDDWDSAKHEAVCKRIQRAMEDGQGWTAFNNMLDRGYVMYLTDAPNLKGFEAVADIEAVLVDALKAIHPPDRTKCGEGDGNFHPYWGSTNWKKKVESTNEIDKDRWETFAMSEKATDFRMIEAEALVAGIAPSFEPPYWRNQIGHGLLLRGFKSREEFALFLDKLESYSLTKAADYQDQGERDGISTT